MTRKATGCSGCGSLFHSVRSCMTEGAARYYDAAGLPGNAARVRRQIAALEKSREERRDEIKERAEARRER